MAWFGAGKGKEIIMKAYDVIEALGQVDDQFVQEAAREGGVKRRRNNRDRESYANGSVAIQKRRRKMKMIRGIAAACLLLLILPAGTVLAVDYFSSIKGDELAFERVEYRGDGIVAVQVSNRSDKVLEFQEDVKLGIFYANREIPQIEGGKVEMEGNVIMPHSTSELVIDLSGAYDMEIADQPLTDDWYYLVLTNNQFVFGQDWQCVVDFQNVIEESTIYRAGNPEETEKPKEYEKLTAEAFSCEDWVSPVEDMGLSACFGMQSGGSFSDHINIPGEKGESVFAVEDGLVQETGFESDCGNYIILELQENVKVKYGHLEEVYVSENQEVKKGEAIAAVGQSGIATGPNLLFALYVDDKPVNPLKAEYGGGLETPELYPAADILEAQLADTEGNGNLSGISSGLNVPAFIAYKGRIYSGLDYDMTDAYVLISDTDVCFNPTYSYTAYEISGRPELVAIIINGGYSVYERVLDVAFRLDGVDYQAEYEAACLGEGAVGGLVCEKNGMKIYQAVDTETQSVIEGKYIVDITELMTGSYPDSELFGDPEEHYADCWWVAEKIQGN